MYPSLDSKFIKSGPSLGFVLIAVVLRIELVLCKYLGNEGLHRKQNVVTDGLYGSVSDALRSLFIGPLDCTTLSAEDAVVCRTWACCGKFDYAQGITQSL